MITVEVISVNGSPPANPLSASFDALGGTIGRGTDCTLVLLDEKRSISRVHARIDCRDGVFLVTDEGTNPLKINGSPLGKGNQGAIGDGDKVQVGPYLLLVKALRADVVDEAFGGDGANPFADLLGDAGASAGASSSSSPFADLGFDQPAKPPGGGIFDDLGIGDAAPPTPAPAPKPAPAASASPFDDLGFGPAASPSPAASSSSPFADLGLGGPSSSSASSSPFDDLGFGASSSPPPKASGSSKPMALPDDFDPMAAPPAQPEMGLGASLSDDAFADFGSEPRAPGEGSLDAMFGLSAKSQADPFAGGALGKAQNSGSSTDSGLTQWLGGIGGQSSSAAPVSDKVPEIHAAFTPPRAVTPQPAPPPKAAPPPPPPAKPAPPKAAPPPPPPPPRPAPPPPPARKPEPPRAAPRRDLPPGDLLGALLAGLDAPGLEIDDLSPELMHRLGVLLNEATQGTLALLAARGTVKRELKADVTMIASGRNNPLKFSPDAKVALRYLLGPPAQGFMGPEEAMKDAYGDLRSHEFGFMAGMRAALMGVLKRFSPEALEARLPEKSGIGGLLAANRKSRLWELFGDHYRQLTQEAEEDFHALFGREFLRAYQEHIEALEQQNRRR